MGKHKRSLASTLALLSAALTSTATLATADDSQLRLRAKAGFEHFTWEEQHEGQRVVKESGVRWVAGLSWDNLNTAKEGWLLSLDGEFYFGSPDYSGLTQVQDPELIKFDDLEASSTTSYFGNRYEAQLGYRRPAENIHIDVLGGLGLDMWTRDIKTATVTANDGDTAKASAPKEQFLVLYTRAGAGLGWQMGNFQHRLQAGIKYPIYIDEYVDALGAQLSPGKKASPFARWEVTPLAVVQGEAGWGLSLYYDTYRFETSAPVYMQVGDEQLAYRQPQSDQDQLGLLLHYYF
ncbi:hypothetical protein [Desulfurispira natronophila]|uniref:Uncharacterized protein n=1 Tax=Desulfurispira natronophila TaxID=682562 RepID=A0A7W7Y397_9BACT|nr:hypothetical protein [Desulfurispira natronophila]MBB5021144.1 hypothetical protein [Desulfurispira natronophila]